MSIIRQLEKAIAGGISLPSVIWLKGSSCSGCSTSVANLIGKFPEGGQIDASDLFINYISDSFTKKLHARSRRCGSIGYQTGTEEKLYPDCRRGIPTALDSMACTVFTESGKDVSMKDAVFQLAPLASNIICAVPCASFGGVPASGSNPLNIRSVSELTGISTVNLPGCPVHPDWLIGTLVSLLCDKISLIDAEGRPVAFYGRSIHSQCPGKPLYYSDCYNAAFVY